MNPLTNSEIAAMETSQQRAARVGQRTQISQQRLLARSHSLVWSGSDAEIRDEARGSTVVFSGTLDECQAEAVRRGL